MFLQADVMDCNKSVVGNLFNKTINSHELFVY